MFKKIAAIMAVLCLFVVFSSIADAKSAFDKPDEGLYYGYFLNQNPYLAKVEIYKEESADKHEFLLTPFHGNTNPNYGPNVPEKSAFACWMAVGDYYGSITFFGKTMEDVIGIYNFKFTFTQKIIDSLEGPWYIEFDISEMQNRQK